MNTASFTEAAPALGLELRNGYRWPISVWGFNMGDRKGKPESQRELLRLREVIVELGVDRRTILKLIHQGKLSGVRISNLWFVYRADLAIYLKSVRKALSDQLKTP